MLQLPTCVRAALNLQQSRRRKQETSPRRASFKTLKNMRASPSTPSPPHHHQPRIQQQHNLEDLSREAEILQGWERLHPPPDVVTPVGARKPSPPVGPNIDANSGQEVRQEGDDGVGTGGSGDGGVNAEKYGGGGDGDGDARERTAKGGRRRRKPAAAVELMIQ